MIAFLKIVLFISLFDYFFHHHPFIYTAETEYKQNFSQKNNSSLLTVNPNSKNKIILFPLAIIVHPNYYLI